MPPRRVRCDRGGGIDHGSERPEEHRQITDGVVGPEGPLLVGAGEHPLEQSAHLRAGLGVPLATRVLHEDVVQRAVLGLQLEHALQVLAQASPGVLVLGCAVGRGEPRAHLIIEDGLDEHFPRGEMAVQRPDPHSCAAGDPLQRSCDAVLGEDRTCGGDKAVAVALRVTSQAPGLVRVSGHGEQRSNKRR